MINKRFFVLAWTVLTVIGGVYAQDQDILLLKNDKISFRVDIKGGTLNSESFALLRKEPIIYGDGDFALEVVWTDWIAPGMGNNAENPVTLTKSDFKIIEVKMNGEESLELLLADKKTSLHVNIFYQLVKGKYYVKRKIAVRDTLFSKHFFHRMKTYDANWVSKSSVNILKEGGFGQPIALTFHDYGFYAGLEYPASTNIGALTSDSTFTFKASQLVGRKITNQWIGSEWVVLGLTPNRAVKKGFMAYLDDIKIEPNRPFTLYNSWYDLRGEKYPVGSYVKELRKQDYMTEGNVLRLYQLFQDGFVNKHQVELDAFVLDDGWDVYASDWALNTNEFPNGLRPVKEKFEQSGTSLGLWFGPSGGYSARMKRIDWFRDNGYEVVGREKTWGGAQLCLGGKKYSELFKRRTAEFAKQGVSYYKWDGFQFSCSEPGHGHPIGLYSQVAILDTLISSIKAVRQVNSNVYHSVTSGTWLSPWWLKHAQQIWMQGEDYGLAEVPSYDSKDAAITYRDIVLYDDLQRKNFWFPVSNMMTHGIIKGKLEELYLDTSLDKFADNAMLYFSRGVSMYELYTSPDLMSEAEWDVIAEALKWAKHQFSNLMNTEMVGGDPAKKEAYGYVHLKATRGVIAARNPFINTQNIKIELNPDFGLDEDASGLVLEKVYPYRWIAPKLYNAGDRIDLSLDGYETAVFEVYPLRDAKGPLVAGVPFQMTQVSEKHFNLQYFDQGTPQLLNENSVRSIIHKGKKIALQAMPLPVPPKPAPIKETELLGRGNILCMNVDLDSALSDITLAFLFTSRERPEASLPHASIASDGEPLSVSFNGADMNGSFEIPVLSSAWYSVPLANGKHHVQLDLGDSDWKGKVEAWVIATRSHPSIELQVDTKDEVPLRPLPPQILKSGKLPIKYKLGDAQLD